MILRLPRVLSFLFFFSRSNKKTPIFSISRKYDAYSTSFKKTLSRTSPSPSKRHIQREQSHARDRTPMELSLSEHGVVNHHHQIRSSTQTFDDDTARNMSRVEAISFQRESDEREEEGKEDEEEQQQQQQQRDVIEVPRGYRRPRRALMRQIPVSDHPTINGARERTSRGRRELEFARSEYSNFAKVSMKVFACAMLAAFAGLLYITTHEFGHAAACVLTKGHRVVKISILSVTIFERPIAIDEPPREASDNDNVDGDKSGEREDDAIITPIGDEYRSRGIQSNTGVQDEQNRAPSKVGYTTCATIQTYTTDIFLIDRKEAWIKVSGYLSTLALQIICVNVALFFNSIIAASFMYPDTFFYAWKRYPNEVQEGFSVLMFNKVLREPLELPPGVSFSSEVSDFSNRWDSKNTALSYMLTGIGVTLLFCQMVVFAVVTEKKFQRRLDLAEERDRLPPLRIPRTRSGV